MLNDDPIIFKTKGGLRTPQAEELVQSWRQINRATDDESLSLLRALEDINLALSAVRLPDVSGVTRPDTFFLQHRDRFISAHAVCGAIEGRLLRSIDSSVARQVETRISLGELPISASALELASKARLDLSAQRNQKRNRSRSRERRHHRRNDNRHNSPRARRMVRFASTAIRMSRAISSIIS